MIRVKIVIVNVNTPNANMVEPSVIQRHSNSYAQRNKVDQFDDEARLS